MLYLAYGSNMAPTRIEARLGACGLVGAGWVDSYDLRFHKAGRDGSGKCDAYFTGESGHRLYGALFELTGAQAERLDEFEGPGYTRAELEVWTEREACTAFAYVAEPGSIEPTVAPYTWYVDFVLHGARTVGLPSHYVERILATPALTDPDLSRAAENARILAGHHRAAR